MVIALVVALVRLGKYRIICCWFQSGLVRVCAGKEDLEQNPVRHVQHQPPTVGSFCQAEEHVLWQTSITELFHRQTQKILCPQGHTLF